MQVAGAQRHDVSIDDALVHGVGEFGRGQLFIILQVGHAPGILVMLSDPAASPALGGSNISRKTRGPLRPRQPFLPSLESADWPCQDSLLISALNSSHFCLLPRRWALHGYRPPQRCSWRQRAAQTLRRRGLCAALHRMRHAGQWHSTAGPTCAAWTAHPGSGPDRTCPLGAVKCTALCPCCSRIGCN